MTPPKVAVPSPAKPAVGVYPKRYKAGDTFKDCDDCPEMVVIPPGSFRMGDLSGDGEMDVKPVREVRIGYSFAAGKFEVTQDEWVAVMGSNPSRFMGGRNPVDNVSWWDAKAFVAKLSWETGKTYRLLSEAEWEYVAWAGTTTKYSWGQEIGSGNANCDGCGSQWDFSRTVPVGSFVANAYGLYDMHGNLWEWVEDCWHNTYAGAPSDGSSWVRSAYCSTCVLRGGSWYYWPVNLRSANRYRNVSDKRLNDGFGFRVSRTVSR